jgi:hypothetical protein
MGIDAAIHAGRVGDAVVLGRRIGEVTGYEQYGRWLAGMAADAPPDATPWQIFDAAPPQVRDSGVHRWLLPMAISLRGRHLEQAREFGLTACEDLKARGTLAIYPIVLAWLAEVELRIGLWDEGCAHAEEGLYAARDIGHHARLADFEALLALAAAARGNEQACVHNANLALACTKRNNLAGAQATWAMGLMYLSRGDHDLAAEHLTGLRHEHVRRAATADAVEALVRLGDIEEASRLTVAFGQWITEDTAPWLHARQYRCQGLLSSDEKEFRLELDNSLPFDRARTALLYGQWLRRKRRIKEARTILRLGHDLFERLGAQAVGRACRSRDPRLRRQRRAGWRADAPGTRDSTPGTHRGAVPRAVAEAVGPTQPPGAFQQPDAVAEQVVDGGMPLSCTCGQRRLCGARCGVPAGGVGDDAFLHRCGQVVP